MAIPDKIDNRVREAAWESVEAAQANAERAINSGTLSSADSQRLVKAALDYVAQDKLVSP
jgi:hypothetical protein